MKYYILNKEYHQSNRVFSSGSVCSIRNAFVNTNTKGLLCRFFRIKYPCYVIRKDLIEISKEEYMKVLWRIK